MPFKFSPSNIEEHLREDGWFADGVHFIVDGQFGSTGKGALAAVIARAGRQSIEIYATNAGPNSGHTAVVGANKIVTTQIPVGAAVARILPGPRFETYLTAGAIINAAMLQHEVEKYGVVPTVHPCAAMITSGHVALEQENGSSKIAGTAKGVGAVLADKVNREGNLWGRQDTWYGYSGVLDMNEGCILHESAQGFSLGVNEARFAPATTSRECSVQQALSDARIPLSRVRKVAMTLRTYPIRVGNTMKGYSGDYYEDQKETSWEELGQPEELTTVTKRVRRVFTWSWTQFIDALRTNEPDLLNVNFMDYLPVGEREPFIKKMIACYRQTLPHKKDPIVLCGFGPEIDQMGVWHD
jgi:adenylosuccinate synthase